MVHQWQLRNGRYKDLSGGALETFIKCSESLLSPLPFLKMKKAKTPNKKKTLTNKNTVGTIEVVLREGGPF